MDHTPHFDPVVFEIVGSALFLLGGLLYTAYRRWRV